MLVLDIDNIIPSDKFRVVEHSHHSCLWLFFSVLPDTCTVSGVKSSKYYPELIWNVTLFGILLIYVWNGGLSASVSCFLMMF